VSEGDLQYQAKEYPNKHNPPEVKNAIADINPIRKTGILFIFTGPGPSSNRSAIQTVLNTHTEEKTSPDGKFHETKEKIWNCHAFFSKLSHFSGSGSLVAGGSPSES